MHTPIKQTRYYLGLAVSAIIAAIAIPAAAQSGMTDSADMLVTPGRWILTDSPKQSAEDGKALEPSELAENSREQIVCLRADQGHTIYDAVSFIVDPEAPHIKRSAFQNGTIEATINMGDAHINITAKLAGKYDASKFDISVHASGFSRDKPVEAVGVFTGRYVGVCEGEDGISKYDTDGGVK